MRWKQVSRFGMKLHLSGLKVPKKIISFDMGSLSTGIGVSCPELKKSYLLKVIKCSIETPAYVKKLQSVLKNEGNVQGIIIGRTNNSLHQNAITKHIDHVATQLKLSKANQQITFCYEDENWTTKQAKYKINEFKQAVRYHGHLHNEKDLEDGIAAIKIMERFLQYYYQE